MPTAKCRDATCEDEPLDGVLFCRDHLGDSRKCKTVRAIGGVDKRCAKWAIMGLEVCSKHGGSWKANREIAARSKILTAMQRFVRPYEGDLNPITGFEIEYRRTLGRIAWYDEQLALLESADDLVWGRTKVEEGTAPDGDGGTVLVDSTTYEAKEAAFHALQFRERQHLLALTKVWIGAGLEVQKLNIMRGYVEAAYSLTVKAIRALGHDPQDPAVRQAMSKVFLEDAAPATVTATQIID